MKRWSRRTTRYQAVTLSTHCTLYRQQICAILILFSALEVEIILSLGHSWPLFFLLKRLYTITIKAGARDPLLIKERPTIYWEIFVLLYFHEFHEFCSVTKLNFAEYCHATPFMLPTWIIFAKLLKLPFSWKFPSIRYNNSGSDCWLSCHLHCYCSDSSCAKYFLCMIVHLHFLLSSLNFKL